MTRMTVEEHDECLRRIDRRTGNAETRDREILDALQKLIRYMEGKAKRPYKKKATPKPEGPYTVKKRTFLEWAMEQLVFGADEWAKEAGISVKAASLYISARLKEGLVKKQTRFSCRISEAGAQWLIDNPAKELAPTV